MTDPSAQLLQPALVGEEDTLKTYPFFLHDLAGGIPLKPRRVFPAAKVLTGSLRSKILPSSRAIRKAGRAKRT